MNKMKKIILCISTVMPHNALQKFTVGGLFCGYENKHPSDKTRSTVDSGTQDLDGWQA